MSQTTHRAPSDILELRTLIRRRYGFDGWWAAYQLDNAVSWLGTYIESKLSEMETVLVNGREETRLKYKSPEDVFRHLDAPHKQSDDVKALINFAKRTGAYRRS